MSFAARAPSAAWESVVLPELPHCSVWAWFKPPQAPQDVLLRIPRETYQACGGGLSLRRILTAAGLHVAEAEAWTVQGMTYHAQGGINPLVDQPLPASGPWDDLGVAVRMKLPAAAVGQFSNPSQPMIDPLRLHSPSDGLEIRPTPMNDRTVKLFEAYEADWQALIQLERQLEAARKQLGAMQSRLQSLNRDLNPDERRAADNQDNRDWQDARRWLRDCLSHVARYIRDHDIGMVSAAGNRNRFEESYKEYVVPRRPFSGLAQVQNEFEQHRKSAQSLLIQMQAAHNNASRDGVARAQQVLGRIAAKVKSSRTKR